MGYQSLAACVADLEKNGHLIRIKEEVDPYLEMAAIHLRVYENKGPAILFENIRGSRFPAVSNLFGTIERSKFIFRDSLEKVKSLVEIKGDPLKALKSPLQSLMVAGTVYSALPQKINSSNISLFSKAQISDLPQIVNWQDDGGPFVTMPQVYTEDVTKPGIMNANLGMYRIQLAGNEYIQNEEIGLHYQLHRGIGIHQAKANAMGVPLKVSVFVGGPPAHPLSAVMPLPEGLSEMTFAGALAGRRFRYFYDSEGFCISADADFVITGTVYPYETKPEGPFGDHLGYYSLIHPFPLMKVHNVYHKKDAIWSFTVVGRPPQEDTSFGALIHEIAGSALPKEIPGLHEVNAVDEAGVHPLLFAIGSERYTPYLKERKPSEILTIANHVLGSNQLSLAKYLFIAAKEDRSDLDTHNVIGFLTHMLERMDFERDLHFYTNTTIDTLDYSGGILNGGSKVVFAAAGEKKRELCKQVPEGLTGLTSENTICLAIPGVITMDKLPYVSEEETERQVGLLESSFSGKNLTGLALIVLCDDAEFTAYDINNLVWVTFTRSNPANDIHGIGAFSRHKHWGCRGPLIIDARAKPHHAPDLIRNPAVEKRVDELGAIGRVLQDII